MTTLDQDLDELHVISDLHLAAPSVGQIFAQTDALAAWIRSLTAKPAEARVGLVLNGDIVDFLADAKPGQYFDARGAWKKLGEILDHRFDHARKTGDVALARATRGLRGQPGPHQASSQERALDEAWRNMRAVAGSEPRAASWAGSMAARWAEALAEWTDPPEEGQAGVLLGPTLAAVSPPEQGPTPASLVELTLDEVLREAERAYRRAFDAAPALDWALVQAINLRWERSGEIDPHEWCTAVWLSRRGLCHPDVARRVAAHDNLAQLLLLRPVVAALPALALPPAPAPAANALLFAPAPAESPEAEVRAHVKELLKLEPQATRSWIAFTLRRQLGRRARCWRGEEQPAGPASAVMQLAQRLADELGRRGVPKTWHAA